MTSSRKLLTDVDTLVVKVGTRVLTNADGTLDENQVVRLSAEFAEIVQQGKRLVVVSSGAIGAGIGRLQLKTRPADLAQLQAAAAVGQSRLTEAYDRALQPKGLHAAQLLLTADDFADRARYLNVRNTLLALFRFGAIPIINENDTVSVDELDSSFGDNDKLAAMVTNMLRAPLLVLLSDVEGLYTGPPEAPDAILIPEVDDIDAAIGHVQLHSEQSGHGASREKIQLSIGGMESKLRAAHIATSAGETVVIASGKIHGTLQKILAGEEVGTLLPPQGPNITARKRWFSDAARSDGQIWLDAGAVRALCENGGSLLPVGITTVQGHFEKGDVVSLVDPDGKEVARGLSNYSSDEVISMAGFSTPALMKNLGYLPYEEVVHRNNMGFQR